MPAINLSIPHKLSPEEAKLRITKLITETKSQFGGSVSEVKESWADNQGTFSFRAMGFAVSGNLQVEPSTVQVEINLPFAALPFKGRVESEISTRAKQLLA
ncbi:MAG: polyhydroxyalkanoic acid system family protein [Verrucomicrobiota bacterium]